jgi:tetratricopeptide (TPR) repeat protein
MRIFLITQILGIANVGAIALIFAPQALADSVRQVEGSAEWYLQRGIELSEEGKYFPAIENYTQAIAQDPTNPLLYYDRAVALSYLQKYEAAISDYTMAITLKPNFIEAYKNRGLVRTQSNRQLDEAVADYAEAIKLAPKDAASYLGKGIALSRVGKNSEAITVLSQAIDIKPTLAIAYFVRASIYIDIDERQLALRDYQTAAGIYQKQNNQVGYKNTLGVIAEFNLE